MHVSDLLEKRIQETVWCVIAEESTATPSATNLCILQNQMQIMRGLHSLLNAKFIPYDDTEEQSG